MHLIHPLSARDTSPPAAVTAPDGATYPIVDGTIDCPADVRDTLADALAEAYDVEPDELVYEEDGPPDDDVDTDGEICGVEMSDGDVCERPANDCPYHGNDED